MRAIGLFSLYPCLRKVTSHSITVETSCGIFDSIDFYLFQDIQFTLDSIEAVTQALKDENQIVRMKASWSLGNISDALVLNRCVHL